MGTGRDEMRREGRKPFFSVQDPWIAHWWLVWCWEKCFRIREIITETERDRTGRGEKPFSSAQDPALNITLMIGLVLGKVLWDNRDNGDGAGWDGRGENLSSVCNIPGKHIYDWWMLGEVFRDNRDTGDRRGENLSAVRFSGLHFDDCFSAGRNVSG